MQRGGPALPASPALPAAAAPELPTAARAARAARGGRGGQLAALTGPALPLAARRQPSSGRPLPGVFPVSCGTLPPSGRRRGRAASTAAAGRPLRPGAPRPRRLSAHLTVISRARRSRRRGSAELQGRAVTLGGEGAAAPGGWGRARLPLRRGAGLPPPGRPLSRWQPAAVPRCALTG